MHKSRTHVLIKPQKRLNKGTQITIDCSPQKETHSRIRQFNVNSVSAKYLLSASNEKVKKEKMFNNIYGITEEFVTTMNNIRKNKKLTLQEHQNMMLKVSTNLRKESVLKLNRQFRNIRLDTMRVHPLPPLKYNDLVEYSKREMNKESQRMKKINKVKYCKTQYEIDMEKDKARYFKQYKENSNINRLYEILPEYVVKAFARKK